MELTLRFPIPETPNLSSAKGPVLRGRPIILFPLLSMSGMPSIARVRLRKSTSLTG